MSGAASSQISKASGDEALASLPHAAPFRFVTRMICVEPGVRAKGIWVVEGQEDFLRGHFPGNPIVPGVLIGEALAQISGILVGASVQPPRPPLQGSLAHIDLRFPSRAVPPAEIVLESTLSRTLDRLHLFEVQATVKHETVARGRITLALEEEASTCPARL
jgi:3-hydroxyacyl-[acyl-carrier-protein] dehydratase